MGSMVTLVAQLCHTYDLDKQACLAPSLKLSVSLPVSLCLTPLAGAE
jgi:hypothetical protein